MDFVTFEIAKKLKEKGYPQNFSRRKSIKAASYHYYNFKGEIDGSVDDNRWYVSCPFISQVLKWLREEKKLHIIIPASFNEGYWWEIIDFNREISEYSDIEYTSYEQAVIACIEYVINNLM